MKEMLLSAFVIFYLGMSVFTFGHALNNGAESKQTLHIVPAMAAFFIGLPWPLYWSWELQRNKKGA